MNCYAALLKGLETVVSVRVHLIEERKVNFHIVIILPSTSSLALLNL